MCMFGIIPHTETGVLAVGSGRSGGHLLSGSENATPLRNRSWRKVGIVLIIARGRSYQRVVLDGGRWLRFTWPGSRALYVGIGENVTSCVKRFYPDMIRGDFIYTLWWKVVVDEHIAICARTF